MSVQPETFDLVCLSHLRWDFVYQRPQHLLSRFAREHRVFFVEEPVVDSGDSGDSGPARLDVTARGHNVSVVVPHLPAGLSEQEADAVQRRLVDALFAAREIRDYVLWYYTPMALAFTSHLRPVATVYDCMDELSAFAAAPPALREREATLFARADLVFTGGRSLYEAKRPQHPQVYLFPSSVDQAHFAQARQALPEPSDQASLPRPRLGYYGVIDERMDLDLVAGIADRRPDWQLVLVGPVVKIDPAALPQRPNIHYLGPKSYASLPDYLAGWDVALIPFAHNDATRYISPTKTPEYLAGGKPVVSTGIRDVISPYGEWGVTHIAEGPDAFVAAIEAARREDAAARHEAVDAVLETMSWDRTWQRMSRLIDAVVAAHPVSRASEHEAAPEVDTGSHAAADGARATVRASAGPDTAPGSGRPGRPDHPDHNGHRRGPCPPFDYLIVGAGFAGSVLAERLASQAGKRVLICDRRNHIGGNAYDHHDAAGLLVHKYGPHIFHTNAARVFDYLSQFTQWRPYQHRVRASVDGQLAPMPINLDTINGLYGLNLTSFQLDEFFASVAEPVAQVRTSEDVVVSRVGRELYEKFFRGYTRKQWGLDPSELDAAVTARVPTRTNRDDRYFTDTYQAMPLNGYTRLFERMLDHPNIKIMLNTDYREVESIMPYREMIYTGPVDEYFDCRYGKLPYRSLEFRFETVDAPVYQPYPVINYPNDYAYTRVTEFKYLTGQEHARTTLVYEYPRADGDPYYPVPRPENAELYKKYKALADETPGVHFVGRLATYKYYNMDQVVAQALATYDRIVGAHEVNPARTMKGTHGRETVTVTGNGARQDSAGSGATDTARAPRPVRRANGHG